MTPRVLVLALLLAGCGRGSSVLVTLDGTLPAGAETVTVTVLQTRVLGTGTFELAGRALPQSVGVVTRGGTEGSVLVIAEANAQQRVVAAGRAAVELGATQPAVLNLRPTCAGAGCGCTRTNCLTESASCGAVLDACGGAIDCGICTGGTCRASTAGYTCESTCSPGGCALNACGLVADGCGGIVDCGPCADGG